MESLDVTHGLYLDGYGINIKARPGLIGKATFVADKPGRFSFRCSETCGEFHPYMIGFLEVTPNTRFNLFLWAIGIAFVLILGLVLCRSKQENGVETNVETERQ
jgi:cytochrome c oxidase subunit 2